MEFFLNNSQFGLEPVSCTNSNTSECLDLGLSSSSVVGSVVESFSISIRGVSVRCSDEDSG